MQFDSYSGSTTCYNCGNSIFLKPRFCCYWSILTFLQKMPKECHPWHCYVRFWSRENPSSQLPLPAAPWSGAVLARPDCRSGVKLKHTLQTFITQSCLKLSSSWQMQGVMGAALNRWLELWVRCAASASRSSTEAASSVLSTSSESWIVHVGRANSSTWQHILQTTQICHKQNLFFGYRISSSQTNCRKPMC